MLEEIIEHDWQVIELFKNPEASAVYTYSVWMRGEYRRSDSVFSSHELAPASRVTAADPVSTRRKRRKIVLALLCQLEQLRDAEERCRDNTPENLQSSAAYEDTEEIVSKFEEAIELIESIY